MMGDIESQPFLSDSTGNKNRAGSPYDAPVITSNHSESTHSLDYSYGKIEDNSSHNSTHTSEHHEAHQSHNRTTTTKVVMGLTGRRILLICLVVLGAVALGVGLHIVIAKREKSNSSDLPPVLVLNPVSGDGAGGDPKSAADITDTEKTTPTAESWKEFGRVKTGNVIRLRTPVGPGSAIVINSTEYHNDADSREPSTSTVHPVIAFLSSDDTVILALLFNRLSGTIFFGSQAPGSNAWEKNYFKKSLSGAFRPPGPVITILLDGTGLQVGTNGGISALFKKSGTISYIHNRDLTGKWRMFSESLSVTTYGNMNDIMT